MWQKVRKGTVFYLNKKKKIVVLHPWLIMGGEEKVLINMLNVLDYDKVEVTLWLLESGGVLEKNLTKNVTVKYLVYQDFFSENSLNKLLKVKIKNREFLSALRCLFYFILSSFISNPSEKEFYKLCGYGCIDKQYYDLFIEYHCYRQDLLYWGLTQFKAKKRAIWLHGADYLNPNPDLRPYAYNRYDKIFAVSEAVKESFVTRYPELKKKTDIFYNIQDIDDILAKAEVKCDVEMIHPAVVTVGRISPEKGMDRIPGCMEKLLADGYDVHWYIIGDGCDREEIEALCKTKGLLKNIHFLGEKQNPYPYMKNADIYVQPSRTEGYCTTTFEAKILKKPIIVTDVSGMREQFTDGETAIIMKEQTSDELYKKIKELLDYPELRQKLVDALSKPENSVSNDLSQLYSLLDLE